MHFTDLFIRKPVLATVLSLIVLLLGGRALISLAVRQPNGLATLYLPWVSDLKGADFDECTVPSTPPGSVTATPPPSPS